MQPSTCSGDVGPPSPEMPRNSLPCPWGKKGCTTVQHVFFSPFQRKNVAGRRYHHLRPAEPNLT